MRGYYQICAPPYQALMSIDDPNFSLPSAIRPKHLPTALMIAVLMQGPIRCVAVRQLYPQDTRTLSTFVCACNHGVLPATLTPLAQAMPAV
jgi:hypothetical protein